MALGTTPVRITLTVADWQHIITALDINSDDKAAASIRQKILQELLVEVNNTEKIAHMVTLLEQRLEKLEAKNSYQGKA